MNPIKDHGIARGGIMDGGKIQSGGVNSDRSGSSNSGRGLDTNNLRRAVTTYSRACTTLDG